MSQQAPPGSKVRRMHPNVERVVDALAAAGAPGHVVVLADPAPTGHRSGATGLLARRDREQSGLRGGRSGRPCAHQRRPPGGHSARGRVAWRPDAAPGGCRLCPAAHWPADWRRRAGRPPVADHHPRRRAVGGPRPGVGSCWPPPLGVPHLICRVGPCHRRHARGGRRLGNCGA
jgi:hypothetical protein